VKAFERLCAGTCCSTCPPRPPAFAGGKLLKTLCPTGATINLATKFPNDFGQVCLPASRVSQKRSVGWALSWLAYAHRDARMQPLAARSSAVLRSHHPRPHPTTTQGAVKCPDNAVLCRSLGCPGCDINYGTCFKGVCQCKAQW
jgi:hypothetical protein